VASPDDFQLLFRKGPVAVLLVDPATLRVLAVNEAGTRALGCSEAELLAGSLRDRLDPGDIDAFAHLVRAAPGLPVLEARSSWRLRRQDGGVARLELSPQPLPFRGAPCAVLFRAAEPPPGGREVGDKNASLSEFSYSALHDLKEPLHLIRGYLQLLRQRSLPQLDAEGREFLEYAYGGTQRMQALVLNLLEYLRADAKGLQTEPLELATEVQEVVAALRFQIQEAEAIVTWDPLPSVRADRTLLTRLLQNLLSNAIKFRVHDRPVHIHLSSHRAPEAGQWEVCVKDNGIGIAMKDQERVLQPFQRVHSTDEYPGTGLGLSICRKIVEHHGGRLWLVSTPDVGTEVHFTLPEA